MVDKLRGRQDLLLKVFLKPSKIYGQTTIPHELRLNQATAKNPALQELCRSMH
jgi:hypothetical protein